MEIFEKCKIINQYIDQGKEQEARNKLILLLDELQKDEIEYTPLVNHLIRLTGLYPYIETDSAILEDQLLYNLFKVDIGDEAPVPLHREQSNLLKKLLEGKNLAISAPTSFGKSFVIDSFISIKKPNNVLIIVPTIALMDETRRRIHKKFAQEYKIITSNNIELSDKNIFIFPQERAIGYIDLITDLDLLVIDEFYKASSDFDKERSSTLQKAILKLSKKAKQKYYLAPNVQELTPTLFTQNMEFISIDFNTVYLSVHEEYKNIKKDLAKKNNRLLELLNTNNDKTLIYAGTYREIENVSRLIKNSLKNKNSELLNQFSDWLQENYSPNWNLIDMIKKGTGVHNGRLHRSLSQIQVKLFEEDEGLDTIVSTSSIIEGVNTSAKNIILWGRKNGSSNLNSFTYKNIIGRGGRMFKHFIGNVYLLEKQPDNKDTQLTIDFSDTEIPDIDETEYKDQLTKDQITKIIEHKEKMYEILGRETYNKLLKDNVFKSKRKTIEKIAIDMVESPEKWKGLVYLNSDNSKEWENSLYNILNLKIFRTETEYNKFVFFVRVLSYNWKQPISKLLSVLSKKSINIDLFFQLEKIVSFNLASILSDINILHQIIFRDKNIDISPFIAKASNAFLPPNVYLLEEYGLPRMLSKKIHEAGIINLEDQDTTIDVIIDKFNKIGFDSIKEQITTFSEFDLYILKYFYEGI